VPLGARVPLERGRHRGVPPFKKRYFDPFGSSSVKTIADRYTHVAYYIITSIGHGLFSFINIDVLERP